MANTHRIFVRRAILTAICLASFACTLVVPAVGQTPPGISKKELKTLSATPADQERLAVYYRDKAEHLGEGERIRGTSGLSRHAACNH